MIEAFERDVLPYTLKWGPYIGEAGMRGDADAAEIINRQLTLTKNVFVDGIAHVGTPDDWTTTFYFQSATPYDAYSLSLFDTALFDTALFFS